MVEIIIRNTNGVEQPEFGRRFHDHAPREMLFDGAPCTFVRFKKPGVAVYRRLPANGARKGIALTSPDNEGDQGALSLLVAEILRAADNLPAGSLDLRSVNLAANSVDLLVTWERLRRDRVCRAAEAVTRPPSSAGALTRLREQGVRWRVAGIGKSGVRRTRLQLVPRPRASRNARTNSAPAK
jgi:hypothetical protein